MTLYYLQKNQCFQDLNGTRSNLLETTYSDDLYIAKAHREPVYIPTTELEEVTTAKATTEAELFTTTQPTTEPVEVSTTQPTTEAVEVSTEINVASTEDEVTTMPPVVVYTMPDNNLDG